VQYTIRNHHADGRRSRPGKPQKAEIVGFGPALPEDGGPHGLYINLALDDDKQPTRLTLALGPDDYTVQIVEKLVERLREMVQTAKVRKNEAELEARRRARRGADDVAVLVERAARALAARRFQHRDHPRASHAYFAPETRSWWAVTVEAMVALGEALVAADKSNPGLSTTEVVEQWAANDKTAEELPRQVSRGWSEPGDLDDQ
jgi:hypothetical protein